MTVRELIDKLLDYDMTAVVTVGKGCGPVGGLTGTVNGFVIIDPVRPPEITSA